MSSPQQTDWPALCAGMIVGVYWARVIKLVVKARRTTGRAANFWPAETLGRVLRIIWYPNVVLWVVVPFVLAWDRSLLLYVHPLLRWTGVIVALGGLIASLVCWKKMGKSWRMGIDPGEKTDLIVTGPYAYVRHPIYGLQSLIMLASMLAAPSVAMIVIGIVQIGLLQWEARREEQYLRKTHGSVYEDYLVNTGRFVPHSLTPYSAAR